jgi:hypothetical protein
MRMRLLAFSTLTLTLACPEPMPRPDGGTGQAPTITSLTPISGPLTGGTTVTINGSRFADGATVRFGDAPGQQVVVANALRLTVRTPAVTNPGRVSVTVTNPDGQSATLPDSFTFDTSGVRAISQALVVTPEESVDRTGAATVSFKVTAQVQVPMVTNGAGQGMGVRGQVGFAAMTMDPPVESDFTWTDATYLSDADAAAMGDALRDVYEGTVMVPGATTTAITYRLAARFSVDNGTTWRLADRDGLGNGVSVAQLARLVVERKGINWCRLGGRTAGAPPTQTLRGTQPGPLVYAQVFVQGVTEGAGAGAGVKGQIGVGTMGTAPASWTWTDASFNVDVGNNDEWQAALPNPGVGTFRFAYRFNLNDGSFVYCDADGNETSMAGGFSEDQTGTLTVLEPGVDSCNLQFPVSANALLGSPGPLAYGRVFAAGITDRLDGGMPMGVTMELGLGPSGVMPDQSSWAWQPATFNVPVTGGGVEFQSQLPASPEGTYAYAFRTRLGTAGVWTYCDLDGSGNGFSTTQAGVFSVTPFNFAECRLQFPTTLTSYEGRPTGLVYGQVFAPGVTTIAADAGAPTGLEAQLGLGPTMVDPAGADGGGGWSWVPAAFNVPVAGGGVEYQARLTGPAPGMYAYVYRVRYQGGAWAYCDADGLANGYQFAQQGALTALPLDVDECVVETATSTAMPNTAIDQPYLARVRVPTITDDAGVGAGVVAQIGYGAPNTTPSAWTTWTTATYDSDTQGTFDRYRGSFIAPATGGTSEVAFRFQVGSRPFVYCDRDGRANGYSSAQAATLTVSSATVVTACQLLMPSAFMLASGSPLTVSVSLAGTGTAAAGAASGFRVQVGMGARDNASTSGLWGWADAAYVNDVSARDVYALTFAPSYTGDRAVSARVSANGGTSWTYCDLNGSDVNGYEVSQQYDVTVTRHETIQFCKTQFPFSASVDAGVTRIFGQVFQAGLTPDAGAPIRAEFGTGNRNAEPGLAWGWSAAPFSGFGLPPNQNNNEYAVDYRPDGGAANYAFRFTLNDGGTWCYGDNDGHGANGSGQAWDGFRGDLSGVVNLGQVVP